MSEVTRGMMLDIIGSYAACDPDYRTALLADPKKVLATQMNQALPASLKVAVVEEAVDTIYLIVPYVAPADGEELTDDELERVAGGKGDQTGGRINSSDDLTGFGTPVIAKGGERAA